MAQSHTLPPFDANLYHKIAIAYYYDDYKTCHSIEAYTLAQRNLASAEIAYYHTYGQLPDGATMIERVIVQADGNALLVHADLVRQ